MMGQLKQDRITHIDRQPVSKLLSCYGWAVNHVPALMLQIVSNDTLKNSEAQINTKQSATTHDSCQTLSLLLQQYLFRLVTEQFKWLQLVNYSSETNT